jgi:hemolysin III
MIINFMQTQDSIYIRQELVNSIHGFGIIFGVVSIPILIAFAIKSDNTCILWWLCMALFFFTTFYFFYTLPRIQHAQAKRTLEILDHISIYFLIAGNLHLFFTNVYAQFFWYNVAIGLVGSYGTGHHFMFFYRKMEDTFYDNLHSNGFNYGCWRTDFLESVPSNIPTMILIELSGLYLMGVVFYLWKKYKPCCLALFLCLQLQWR